MEKDCSNRNQEINFMQLPWYEEDSFERIPISDPVWTLEKAAAFFKQKFLSLNTETISTNNHTVLPNNILNAQTCTKCLNYLSIGPVRIKSNREFICGRKDCCIGSNSLPISLYNILAKQYYFKCVHNYGGCNVITLYSEEMKKHEELCKFVENYVCPYLECKFLGNGCQLIQHYKRCHLKSFAGDCVFKINENSGLNKILCPLKYDLLMIHLNCVGKKLTIGCSIINTTRKDKNYCLIIFSPKIDINYMSKPTAFGDDLEIDLDFVRRKLNSINIFGAIRISPKYNVHTIEEANVVNNEYKSRLSQYIHLDDNFTRAVKKCANIFFKIIVKYSNTIFGAIGISHITEVANNEYKNSISQYKPLDDNFSKSLKNLLKIFSKIVVNCCNCNRQIIDKSHILICPQSHFSCIYCWSHYCKQCETECKDEWINVKMEYENCSLYCDWPKCNKKVKCLQFINHKQICCKREYQCPRKNCQFTGNREELLNHWYDCNSAPLKFGKILDFSLKETKDIYWITDELHEMLRVDIVRDREIVVKVNETSTIFSKNYELDLYLEYKGDYNQYQTLIQKDITKTSTFGILTSTNARLIMRIINNPVLDDIPDTVVTKDDQPTSETVIKQLVNIFFKLQLNCNNCKTPLKIDRDINICNINSHISCKHCSISRCEGCNSDKVEFVSLNSIFNNLRFSCDWTGCSERTTYLDYLQHKQKCLQRQYECPIGCERHNNKLKVTQEELKEHFRKHDKNLHFGTDLNFEINDRPYQMYWVPENVKELLIVNLIVRNNDHRLVICEKYSVFSNNYKIELYRYDNNKMHFKKILVMKQVGSFKKYPEIVSGKGKYRLTLVD